MRLMPLRNILGQWNFAAPSSPLLEAVLVRHEAPITGERQFGELLCLERRRAERSRKPFLLMLIDLREAQRKDRTGDLVQRVWSSICSASRDSDIRGWYLHDAILGVIFVELNPDEPVSVTDIIHAKVSSALTKNLKSEEFNRLSISIYLQPDSAANWERWSKLYRDLRDNESGRKIPLAMKRMIDVVGSATALFFLLPLLAVIALLIKVTSRGPVLFRQFRVGQYGVPFACLKFRTMFQKNDLSIHKEYMRRFIEGKTDSGGSSVVYKISNDPRVTWIGRLLRKASLDELPQFWNVLKGDMSLVGPRPPIPYEVECYDIWHTRRILEVKPGITGLWQVTGRSRTTFNDMVRLDLQYARSWSIWLDLKILLETPRAIISGDGAY